MVRSYSSRASINDFPKCHKEYLWVINTLLMQVRFHIKLKSSLRFILGGGGDTGQMFCFCFVHSTCKFVLEN